MHKHFGMLLDDELSYKRHLKFKKAIGLLRKFQQSLPRHYLLTIYKSFIQPHLDYGDIVIEPLMNHLTKISNL